MKAVDRLLTKNLAHTAEIINTINGGMTQPVLKIERGQKEWLVNVRVPGVNVDHLKIEVRDNQLFLFHLITEPNTSDIQLPYLVAGMTLSRKIDFDAINAVYENGEIMIHLPTNETATGYEREIEIFKK